MTVSETEDSERIELPLLPEDNSLSFNTLVHAFPGAHGLKYKNAVTGASRALLLVYGFQKNFQLVDNDANSYTA